METQDCSSIYLLFTYSTNIHQVIVYAVLGTNVQHLFLEQDTREGFILVQFHGKEAIMTETQLSLGIRSQRETCIVTYTLHL